MSLLAIFSRLDNIEIRYYRISIQNEVSGSGKGQREWFKLEQVNVSYDHPTDAQLDHALNIDFVNEKEGPSARVAVELSPESAKKLVDVILTTLSRSDPSTVRTGTYPNRRVLPSYILQRLRGSWGNRLPGLGLVLTAATG